MSTEPPRATLPTVDLARGLLGRGEVAAATALLDEALVVARARAAATTAEAAARGWLACERARLSLDAGELRAADDVYLWAEAQFLAAGSPAGQATVALGLGEVAWLAGNAAAARSWWTRARSLADAAGAPALSLRAATSLLAAALASGSSASILRAASALDSRADATVAGATGDRASAQTHAAARRADAAVRASALVVQALELQNAGDRRAARLLVGEAAALAASAGLADASVPVLLLDASLALDAGESQAAMAASERALALARGERASAGGEVLWTATWLEHALTACAAGQPLPVDARPDALDAICARVPRLAARRATLLARVQATSGPASAPGVDDAWREAIERHRAIGAHAEALRLSVAQYAGRPLHADVRAHLATLERDALRQRRLDVVVDAALLRLRDALRREPGAAATVDAAARLAELAARHGRPRQHAEALDGWLAAATAARDRKLMGRLVVAITHKQDAWPDGLRHSLLLRAAEACLQLGMTDDARRWLDAARPRAPAGRAGRLELSLLAAQGRHAEVDAAADAWLRAPQPDGTSTDRALIARAWADLILERGDLAALQRAQAAAAAASLALFDPAEPDGALRAARAAHLLGQTEDALALLDKLPEDHGLDVAAIAALRMQVLIALGRPADAAAVYREEARRRERRPLPGPLHVIAAQALAQSGELTLAAAAAEQGLAAARARGAARALGAALMTAGQIEVARGETVAGGRLLGEALGVTALVGAPEHAQVQALLTRLLASAPGSP